MININLNDMSGITFITLSNGTSKRKLQLQVIHPGENHNYKYLQKYAMSRIRIRKILALARLQKAFIPKHMLGQEQMQCWSECHNNDESENWRLTQRHYRHINQ